MSKKIIELFMLILAQDHELSKRKNFRFDIRNETKRKITKKAIKESKNLNQSLCGSEGN